MKFGVVIFPGSNCDHDAFWTIQHVAKQPVTFLWHESHNLENCDAIIVPGGFAYGDYLRTGAIAKFSPVMESVRKFAADGGLVLGICNGLGMMPHPERSSEPELGCTEGFKVFESLVGAMAEQP